MNDEGTNIASTLFILDARAMVPELGAIEGHFGKPWGREDRKRVLTRLRDLGYSWFHHAPKADAFLRRRWREPHPPVAFAELADLSAHCRSLGMRFGIGLNPCELYRDDTGAAKAGFAAKLRVLDEIGIDDLAILFDDTRGDVPDLAAREVGIGHLTRVAESLRRKPTLGDNYPVNDGPQMSRCLHLRGFTGRPSAIGPHIAAHAINPAMQPHLSLIPAATLAASYRQGPAYAYMRAFREAARALAGEELAPMLEEDLHALQDLGLDRLGDERQRLRQRYLAVNPPMAAEVVHWLDGADTVDRWVEEA